MFNKMFTIKKFYNSHTSSCLIPPNFLLLSDLSKFNLHYFGFTMPLNRSFPVEIFFNNPVEIVGFPELYLSNEYSSILILKINDTKKLAFRRFNLIAHGQSATNLQNVPKD